VWREADREAADACKAQRRIVAKIKQLAEWMTSLRWRHLRLQLHPGRVGPGVGTGLRYNVHLAAKRGKEQIALESRAQADSFRLLSAARELAGEEIRLAAEVDLLQEMVKG
jgi:hypothetical protein